MADDRFQRIEALFHRVLALEAEERRRLLERECGGDETLLREVEHLLELDARASLPPAASGTEEDAGERPGSTIGPYRIVRRIGSGGMGVVYEAEQDVPIRRRVAIKLIRRGLDTDKILARFDRERQAHAKMSHPDISRVLDAGATPDGRPYFAMELVDGLPLLDFCDRQRLSLGERLTLFARVCEAVHHAHQKGVVHRDLKPSNILVTADDGGPLPKIIDFGIAKALFGEEGGLGELTRHGEVLGTPEYMSPEQAVPGNLDIDTRADIYSLGVLLYVLVAGRHPFVPAGTQRLGVDELLRRVREETPPKPSICIETQGAKSSEPAHARRQTAQTWVRAVRGDLDWIVLQAMEKDRERRYPSANDLATDVRRHLKNEPVTAGPPSASYRLAKFVRRHRFGVGIATLFVLTLIGAVVATGLALNQAIHSERQQRVARFEAELAALRAARVHPFAAIHDDATELLSRAAESARALPGSDEARRQLRDEAIALLAVARGPRRAVWSHQGTNVWYDESGARFAVGFPDGAVEIRGIGDGAQLQRLAGPGSDVRAVRFSADGRRVATLHRDPTDGSTSILRVHNVGDGSIVLERSGVRSPSRPTLSAAGETVWYIAADGDLMALQITDGEAAVRVADAGECPIRAIDGGLFLVQPFADREPRVIDPATGQSWAASQPTRAADCVDTAALSRKTGLLALAWRGEIFVQGEDGAEPIRLQTGGLRLSRLAFHPSGNWLISQGRRQPVRVWDLPSRSPLFTTAGSSPRFDATGALLIHSIRGQVVVRDWIPFAYLRTLGQTGVNRAPWLTFDGDGRRVAATTPEGVAIWNLGTLQPAATIDLPGAVAVIADPGREAFLVGGRAGINSLTGSAIRDRLHLSVAAGHGRLTASADGRLLGIVAAPGRAMLAPRDAKPATTLSTDRGAMWIEISPGGRFAATAPWNGRGVEIWNTSDGSRVAHLYGDDERMTRARIDFAADGRLLAVSPDRGPLCLFDTRNWTPTVCDEHDPAGPLPHIPAFSEDGTLLAVASSTQGLVRLLDPRDLRPLARLTAADTSYPRAIDVDRTGGQVALSTVGGTHYVWNVAALRVRLAELDLDW